MRASWMPEAHSSSARAWSLPAFLGDIAQGGDGDAQRVLRVDAVARHTRHVGGVGEGLQVGNDLLAGLVSHDFSRKDLMDEYNVK